MKAPQNTRQARIAKGFIAYLSRSLALATLGAMGLTSAQAVTNWTPISNVSTDGFNWLNGDNWDSFTVPAVAEDITFALGESLGTVLLNGNQTVQSLTFNDNYTLGAAGTTETVTNNSGTVSVNVGKFVTMNQRVGGAAGLTVNGGGSLYLTNTLSPFAGNIIVDNGSTLVHRQEGPTPQYNGAGSSQEFGRFDQVSLGFTTAARTITLQNGGVYKILNSGNNSEGNYKNIVIGTGGGTVNMAAGYLLQNLDDVGQITATTNTFTKAGKGRLSITGGMGAANPLGGIVNIDGGMLDLSSQASQAVGANTYVRFVGIAGLGTTLNINNGGTMMVNNGTQARLDVPTLNLNNGGILGVNGADHIIGAETGGTTLNISGTAKLLARDLFAPANERLVRIRTDITGSGTLEIHPNSTVTRGFDTVAANPRVVIERNTSLTGFTGTIRLMENQSLEGIPRNNPTASIGKVIGEGDVEFAGWNSRLDIRDSTAAVTAFDYSANNISITTAQRGAVNQISVNRADAATGTDNMMHFGVLNIGSHYLGIAGGNSYDTGFSGTANVTGNARFRMNSADSWLVFTNANSIAEDAAGRSVTITKAGQSDGGAREVIVGGNVSVSNFNIEHGSVQLRGGGALGTGFGGAAPTITINGGSTNTNALPTPGILSLESNASYSKTAVVIAAANNNDRIVDSATLNLRGNSTVRLTSANNVGTTETVGTTNIYGHGTIDIVKTGTATSPVAVTLSNLTLGTNATANLTGTTLGTTGNNSSRIVIPSIAAITPLGAQYHSGNEWAKYDNTVDSGFELGATPFVAADYTIDATATDAGWAAGQQLKLTSATGTVLSADRTVDRVNSQLGAANQSINLAGFKLTVDQGGFLASTNTTGIRDGAVAAAPSGTAGITAGSTSSPASLYFHANSQVEIMAPITDNAAGGAVTFVKSGTGSVILSHQDRAVAAAQGTTVFTSPTWSSTHTGGWVINDGILVVHRGQYLGASPTTITLNGGQLESQHPVSNANADSILSGWGHNIVVNGNATVGADDNGEANDGSTGDRALLPLGSLIINNNSTLATGGFSDIDIYYAGGTTINGRATFNVVRNANNSNTILGGVVSGSGFDVAGYNQAGGSIVLGAGAGDSAANTFTSGITMYAGILRLNKANGTTALPDTADAEDLVINGGNLVWGTGQYGDLATTNNVNTTNNGVANGIMPTSPLAVQNAGKNQIADTANVTLLTGSIGEADRINNEVFGGLTMKNGTLNVGLGTIEVSTATISGGAFGIDRSGAFKAGTLTLQPGAPDLNITTGLPVPGSVSVLEVGVGGLAMSGQNITLGSGSSGNV